jgi:hypothetical protein
MMIRKNSLKLYLAGIVLVTYLALSFCLKAESNNLSGKSPSGQGSVKSILAKSTQGKKRQANSSKDKMVTINVVNFGRKNPFMPYKKYNMVTGDTGIPADIPPPPHFGVDGQSQLRDLVDAKVNGILYDPYGKSIAILNIKGSDYMVARNNSVLGFYIENVTRDTVTVRYGSNVYCVNVGDTIGNDSINFDPVRRSTQSFGGGYRLPSINQGY